MADREQWGSREAGQGLTWTTMWPVTRGTQDVGTRSMSEMTIMPRAKWVRPCSDVWYPGDMHTTQWLDTHLYIVLSPHILIIIKIFYFILLYIYNITIDLFYLHFPLLFHLSLIELIISKIFYYFGTLPSNPIFIITHFITRLW